MEAIEVSNAEMAQRTDRTALNPNLISGQCDEALAKAKMLEKSIRAVTEGKIKIARIIRYCNNSHTPHTGHIWDRPGIVGRRRGLHSGHGGEQSGGGEIVLREHFPFFQWPLAADDSWSYRNLFGTLQRCWAHIRR